MHYFARWHLKLAYIDLRILKIMAKHQILSGILAELALTPPRFTCRSCNPAKKKHSAHSPTHHVTYIASHISSDTCGPVTPVSKNCNMHFVTFTGTHSRYFPLREHVGRITTATIEHMRKHARRLPQRISYWHRQRAPIPVSHWILSSTWYKIYTRSPPLPPERTL